MADMRISDFPAATTLGGAEKIAAVQSGGNVAITPAQLASFAGGKSANTQALIAALAAGRMVRPTRTLPTADVPTLTYGTYSNVDFSGTTISGSTMIADTDARFRYAYGVLDRSFGTKVRGSYYGSGRAGFHAAVEFVHSGTVLELAILNSGVASMTQRLIVNGALGAAVPFNNGGGAGGLGLLRVEFPSAGTRTLRWETGNTPFAGVRIASGDSIAAVATPAPPVMPMLGDSFVQGLAGVLYAGGGEAHLLGRAVGGDPYEVGVGGTGLFNPGSGGTVNWLNATRLADLTLAGSGVAPTLGHVFASVNDQSLPVSYWSSYGPTFQEAYGKGLDIVVDAWIAANPGKPLVLWGPTWPVGTPTLDAYRMRDACAQAAAMRRGDGVRFIDRLSPMRRIGFWETESFTGSISGNTLTVTVAPTRQLEVGSAILGGASGTRIDALGTGTGGTGTYTVDRAQSFASGTLYLGTEQASLYTSADGTHPSQAGHEYDALADAFALRELILTDLP